MEPEDVDVVQTAARAAEGLIFSRYHRSEVEDLDVMVRFEEGILEVDVYLNVEDEGAEQVTEDAVLAAESAVDELFADEMSS